MEVPVIVGEDPIVRKVAVLAERLAATAHPIFIAGESGVGRGHTARFLHARGPRAVAPLSIFDCGAAVRGAVLTQLADDAVWTSGGTLVLANCHALTAPEAAAVAASIGAAATLRVVLTAAPGVDSTAVPVLAEMLGALPLYLPPLRFRRADIPALVSHFAAQWRRERNVAETSFSAAAMLGMWRHDWPGNVRELRDETLAALERCGDGAVGPDHLPARFFPGPRRVDPGCIGGGGRSIPLRARTIGLFA